LSERLLSIKDEKGFYFIDRDGEYFKPILDWLRTDELIIPSMMNKDCVAREAAFFSINIPNLYIHLKRAGAQQNRDVTNELQHDGFYLPVNIREQKGVCSNASVLLFRFDGSGFFSDAK